jgi:DNA-binding transcriptional ArsR family regulator
MRISRTNHRNFNRHINRLSSLGLVERKRLGRIIVIRLREDSKVLGKIIKTYKIWRENDK